MVRNDSWKRIIPWTNYGLILLFVIHSASIKKHDNGQFSHNRDLIVSNYDKRYADNIPLNAKHSVSRNGNVFKLPTFKIRPGRKVATTKAEKARTSKRRRRKQNNLISLKKRNFWGKDFDIESSKKIISDRKIDLSKQEIFRDSGQYLDKSPFIQQFNKHRSSRVPKRGTRRSNIVLIMTDDLDVELGSLNYMPKLLRLLGDEGAMFSNSYTSTPMCCPSRSSMLTGMYIHNHEVYTNNQNCSSILWQNTHEKRSFATYLRDSGYKTGFFGKYLNRYNGSHVPPGWSEWGGLIGNSRYYNYSVNHNHRFVKYGNRYPQDYFPHVVTSEGINFLRRHASDDDPYLLVISYPAPHGPEDSAPEHSHKFFNASDHHTASYNYAPNPDKQWILQWTDRMGAIEMKFSDLLMTKRLQTLQSVDESITKIIYELQQLKQLENTYVFFTSDHGYHLGQFGLAKGKSMPFEFDIKVPFFVRGPRIKPGLILPNISLNIDLAPTFLDIAGLKAPNHMDGRSLLRVLEQSSSNKLENDAWRDTFLVESSGRVREEEELLKKEQRTYEREKALSMSLNQRNSVKLAENGIPLYTSKHERFQEVCKQEKLKAPCQGTQKWFCLRNGDRWRLKKCRNNSSIWRKRCICQSKFGFGTFNKLDSQERRRQKKFIKRYVAKNRHGFNAKFIQSFNQLKLPLPTKKRHNKQHRNSRRFIRAVDYIDPDISFDSTIEPHSTKFSLSDLYDEHNDNSSVNFGSFEDLSEDDAVHAFVAEAELKDLENQIIDISDELLILENITVNLNKEENIENNPFEEKDCNFNESLCHVASKETINMWKNSKLALKDHIIRLKQQLSVIKDIYIHLQETQPNSQLLPLESIDNDWKVNFNESNSPKHNYYPLEGSFVLGKDTGLKQLFDKHGKKYYDPNGSDERLYIKSPTKKSHLHSSGKHNRKVGLKKWRNKQPKENKNMNGYIFDVEGIKLQPIPLNYLLNDFTKFGNEALSPVCWCDERVFVRLEMQKRRSQRRIERKKLKEERHRRRLARRQKKKQKLQWCAHPNLHCFAHDNNHWRTPPLWNDGSFCFCISASNNTYWCLRTISNERNFLYCEFITGLVTYYDLHIDPYQLRNVAFTLSSDEVLQLHSKLTELRTCSGGYECHAAEQLNNSEKLKKHSKTAIYPHEKENSSTEPQNEVFLTKSFTRKNRNKIIKNLRRKLRRRLKKKKQKKNKYVAMSTLPESTSAKKLNVKYPRKMLRKINQKNKRKRHRKHRRKRKSKTTHIN